MRFRDTILSGVWIVEPQPYKDERGLFARTFCAQEFAAQGLPCRFVQCNTSWNRLKGTLRGMHYQLPPSSEAKLIRCTAGSIWDVIVDLRPGSPTYLQHFGIELSAQNRLSLFIPEMFAHGFQTLEDETEAAYQMSEFYAPELSKGLRYNDPRLAIRWPLPVSSISEKDESWDLIR
ncbi:MAG: dTDP-4-dehydrorhamnose 3,5-epimerase [Verrucomicrobia bacterium]|nr:dTDP-4-dehydrorhamnose 3,5-epimerase [Verrucomicrobiota bacterium]